MIESQLEFKDMNLNENVNNDKRNKKQRRNRFNFLKNNVHIVNFEFHVLIAIYNDFSLNFSLNYFDISKKIDIDIINIKHIVIQKHVKYLVQNYFAELLKIILNCFDQKNEVLRVIRDWNIMQQNAQAVFRVRDRVEIKNIQQSIELKQINKDKLETQFKVKQLKLITNRKRNQKATSKKNEFTFSFKFKKRIREKIQISNKRFSAFTISSIFKNEIDSSYDIWKLRILNKFQINVDWYHTNFEKTISIISWITNEIAKHLNVLRLNNLKYFKNENMMFDMLNNLYFDSNRVRNAKKKYKKFRMKSKQTFIKFYSDFIILINQLKKYSEKIKINDLKHKIIFNLRRVLVNLNDFTFLKILKRKLLFVDAKLNHINNDVKSNINVIKTLIKKTIEIIAEKFVNVKFFRSFFDIEKKTFTRITAREQIKKNDNSNCFECESHDHRWNKCDFNFKTLIWMNKKIKQEIAFIKMKNRQALKLINFENARNYESNVNITSEFDFNVKRASKN